MSSTLSAHISLRRPHWNGRDEKGRRAPAGVYFVRWQASGRSMEAKGMKLR